MIENISQHRCVGAIEVSLISDDVWSKEPEDLTKTRWRRLDPGQKQHLQSPPISFNLFIPSISFLHEGLIMLDPSTQWQQCSSARRLFARAGGVWTIFKSMAFNEATPIWATRGCMCMFNPVYAYRHTLYACTHTHIHMYTCICPYVLCIFGCFAQCMVFTGKSAGEKRGQVNIVHISRVH